MTVLELIQALKDYARSAPTNGNAQIVLRAHDGETCSPIHSALDGKGLPGQHFLVFVPESASFKLRDAMKIN